MLLPTCSQNIDGISFDVIKPKLSNMHQTSYIVLLSSLFMSNLSLSNLSSLFNRLDLSFFNFEKINEKLISEFLWHDMYRY